jgi:hypothetical protein
MLDAGSVVAVCAAADGWPNLNALATSTIPYEQRQKAYADEKWHFIVVKMFGLQRDITPAFLLSAKNFVA